MNRLHVFCENATNDDSIRVPAVAVNVIDGVTRGYYAAAVIT